MKRFVKMPFFCLIKTEQDVLLSALEGEYDEFAVFLFQESSKMERLTYHHALIYTLAELKSLLDVSEKKAYK